MITFKLPQDFLIGTATSAAQTEGAPFKDGKGENIWDRASRLYPEKFWGAATPEPGAWFYTHFAEDIRDMKAQNLKSFRFSISWTRILPEGTGRVNRAGIDFYNRVIDLLLENGIEPFVDIYHWDLPQALADKGGFKNPEIVNWFREFARILFTGFGDRVKLWSTMNEPSVFCFSAYTHGNYPPFEKSLKNGLLAAQNILLCHYAAVRLYREMGLCGKIGAVLAIVPMMPSDPTGADVGAARRQMDRVCDWWLRPMFEGKYPDNLLNECPTYRDNMPLEYAKTLAAHFLPMDFVGLNYYFPGRVVYRADMPALSNTVENYYAQPGNYFQTYPAGLYDAMLYITKRYHAPEMYITENGCGQEDTGDKAAELADEKRIAYIREHLRMTVRAIQAGANIKGYYYWANTDDYEMTSGYRYRFGLTYVDFETGERTRKKSWYYYKKIAENGMVD